MKRNVWFDVEEEKNFEGMFSQKDHPKENAMDLYCWPPMREDSKAPKFSCTTGQTFQSV